MKRTKPKAGRRPGQKPTKQPGIPCPCGCRFSEVVRSEPIEAEVRRFRKCAECGAIWVTWERRDDTRIPADHFSVTGIIAAKNSTPPRPPRG